MTEIDNDRIDTLVRRHRQLSAAIAELAAEQADLKSHISEIVPVGWKSTVDSVPVSCRPANRVFCAATAVSLLGTEDRKACQIVRYDDKLLKARVESLGLLDETMLARVDAAPVLKL